MFWYNTEDAKNPHVLWSKVRYMRNIASLPFNARDKELTSDHGTFSSRLSELMEANGFHSHQMTSSSCAEMYSLAEKQLIDYSFAIDNGERCLYFNEPCNLTIFSGGEFHLNIQALLSGLSLGEAHKIASEAEELLDREFSFAYSDKLGYLTSDIALCGSALELSVCLFLPAARHGARYGDMQREAAAYGATLSPFLAKYDNAGDLYVLSYIPSLALDEKKAISDFSALINLLVSSEISCEGIVFSNKSTIISDRAWRALGTLATARMIDEDELLSLISRIRLAIALPACRDGAPKCPISLLNTLTCEGLNGAVAASLGSSCHSLDDCRVGRADGARKYILPLISQLIGAAI